MSSDDNDVTGWAALLLIFALGVGWLVASLTPGLRGPGFIAFALGWLLGDVLLLWVRRRL